MAAREDKRAQIMKAAEELFTARRFHEITVDEIAHRAGVGKGTIYRYFADKESLFVDVAASGYDALCGLVDAHASGGADFRESLLSVCDVVAEFFLRRSRLWQMMQTEERRQLRRRGQGRKAWLERRGRLLQALVGILRRGLEEGQLRDDMPLEQLATALLGMLRAGAHSQDTLPPLPGNRVAELFLYGAALPKQGDGTQ